MTSRPRAGGLELSRRGRAATGLLALAVLTGCAFLGVLPRSRAVVNGEPAPTDMAQVRIFENGKVRGGGTVIDPHWVLTVGHAFRRVDSNAYSLAFGVVNASDDPSDQSNLRQIDRIVLHPTLADVALAHFADPVPSTVHIPQLAQAAPARYAPARMYGWGPRGRVLRQAVGLVIDPVARKNAALLRSRNPEFAETFPAGIDPMVTSMLAHPGDSGSGVFGVHRTLLGVQAAQATYRYTNASGSLAGPRFFPSFQEPVWYFRSWINQVISGEGTSDPNPPHDELKRRRLADAPAGAKAPMTAPPPTDSAAPTWPVATLTPESGTQGLVTVACPTVSAARKNAGAAKNICTQGIDGQLTETVGNDDPVKIRVGPSGRPVMAWCRTTDASATGAKPAPVIRVSFTNTDTADTNPPPTGYGWYDVNPAQVLVGRTTIHPTTLATC